MSKEPMVKVYGIPKGKFSSDFISGNDSGHFSTFVHRKFALKNKPTVHVGATNGNTRTIKVRDDG